MTDREIEVKFLEINKSELIAKLQALGATDLGEDKITEQIFYDRAGKWKEELKFARIRKTRKETVFTYKHTLEKSLSGVQEIEFKITEPEKVAAFLAAIDITMYRQQEKIRLKFKLGEVTVDIDTWPKVPTYVELEGPDENSVKTAADQLGFDWSKGRFGTAAEVIEEVYKMPVRSYKFFTFEKVE